MIEKNLLITKIFDKMEEIKQELFKAQGTNKVATRRVRLKLVELEKLGKEFRKTTIKREKEERLWRSKS